MLALHRGRPGAGNIAGEDFAIFHPNWKPPAEERKVIFSSPGAFRKGFSFEDEWIIRCVV